MIQERNGEGKGFIEFKLRWGELAKEAMKILSKIKELEGNSAKLLERKNAGEFVKDLLKENKIELKRLRKKEFKIYFESKKVLSSERKRFYHVICPNCGAVNRKKKPSGFGDAVIIRVLYPRPPAPRLRAYVCYNCGYEFSSFEPLRLDKYELNNFTEEDKLVLYRRQLELADKLRLGRIKSFIIVIVILFIPIIIAFFIIQSYL